MTTCDHITHRLAGGDALNEDQLAHVELCTSCAAALAATRTITSIGRARAAIDPNPGYASRIASRAFERVAERRRHRIAGYAVGTAGAVAMAAMVGLWWRADDPSSHTTELAGLPAATYPIDGEAAKAPGDDDLDDGDALTWLTDADRALDYSANWAFIEEPLEPYAALLGDPTSVPTIPPVPPVPPVPPMPTVPTVPTMPTMPTMMDEDLP
jgi:hypothetical protein